MTRTQRNWIAGAFVLAILFAVVLGVVFRDVIFADGSGFFVGFYASWVEDTLFFLLVGLAVTLATTRHPRQGSFDERARHIYGKDAPEFLIDSNRKRLQKLGGYAPNAERKITLQDYNAEKSAYFAQIETTFTIRNIFRDSDYIHEAHLSIMPDPIDNQPNNGEIISIKLGADSDDQVKNPIAIPIDQGFSTSEEYPIPAGKEISYSYTYRTWLKVGAEQSMQPVHPVGEFTMQILNQCGDVTPKIAIDEDRGREFTLLFNRPHRFEDRSNIEPKTTVFAFRMAAPAQEDASAGQKQGG